jgi:hypothetical protein
MYLRQAAAAKVDAGNDIFCLCCQIEAALLLSVADACRIRAPRARRGHGAHRGILTAARHHDPGDAGCHVGECNRSDPDGLRSRI